MAELEHWEAQEASAQARQRRKPAAAHPRRDTQGAPNPDAEGRGGARRERYREDPPAAASLDSSAGRAASSIFGAVSGTVTGLLSAGARDIAFAGLFPQSARRTVAESVAIPKPSLHRGPRGEVIYEWLASEAPVRPVPCLVPLFVAR